MNETNAPKPPVPVYAIAAFDEQRVIGMKGDLPWRIPEDLKHFAKLTKGHTVLMGRKTFDSLRDPYKPLPGRKNLVLSRHEATEEFPNTFYFKNLSELSSFLGSPDNLQGEILWVVGGAQIYLATMSWWDRVYITSVFGKHEGDAYFPPFEEKFECVTRNPSQACSFDMYERKR